MFAIDFSKAQIETTRFGRLAASKRQNIVVPYKGQLGNKEAAIDMFNRWLDAADEFTWVNSFGSDSRNIYVVASNVRH